MFIEHIIVDRKINEWQSEFYICSLFLLSVFTLFPLKINYNAQVVLKYFSWFLNIENILLLWEKNENKNYQKDRPNINAQYIMLILVNSLYLYN